MAVNFTTLEKVMHRRTCFLSKITTPAIRKGRVPHVPNRAKQSSALKRDQQECAHSPNKATHVTKNDEDDGMNVNHAILAKDVDSSEA